MSLQNITRYKNTNKIYVCVFICMLLFSITDCCRFGAGQNCAFPCNCNNNGCDQETGDCIGYGGCRSALPSGYGWGGYGCLIGNIAYGRGSSQSSNYSTDRYLSTLGNDGDINCGLDHFTHTQPENPAWFKIDLDGKYRIQNVTVYDATDGMFRDRLFGSRIQVLDTSFVQDCANITQDNYSKIMTFTCDLLGDAVRIYRDLDKSIIHICEVVVMGHIHIANTADCQIWENDIVGCSTCPAGKRLPDCVQDCPSGYYGVNCQYQCSSNCQSGSSPMCDLFSGRCISGCQQWYIGDKCETEIVELQVHDSDVSATSTSSTITITWKAATYPPPGTKAYYHYIIRIRGGGEYIITPAIPLSDDVGATQSFTLYLSYNVLFEYSVRSVRTVGILTEFYDASWRQIKTKCKAPEVPTDITLSGDDTTFRVSWKTDVTSLNSGCDTMTLKLEYRYTEYGEWQSVDITGSGLRDYPFPYTCCAQMWARLTATNNEQLVSSTDIFTTISGLKYPSADTTSPQDSSTATQCPSYENLCGTNGPSPTLINVAISMMAISVIVAVASVLGAMMYVRRTRQQLSDKTSYAAPNTGQTLSNFGKTTQPEGNNEAAGTLREGKNQTEYYNMTPRNETTDYEDVHPINNYQTLDNRQEPNTPVNTVYQSLE